MKRKVMAVMVKDTGASVRARLLNFARDANLDFNFVLLQYAQERFLYRLSVSEFREELVLKGALLFLIYDIPGVRPTRDIDFLERKNDVDMDALVEIGRKICAIPVTDGVEFLAETVSATEIREHQKYFGVRVRFKARLAGARVSLQIDVGYGDVVIPAAQLTTYPTILADQPAPQIFAYSRESAIAEKFETIVSLNFVTSRMKDFYDILFMAENTGFRLSVLHEAITATFKRRNRLLANHTIIFSDDFRNDSDKQREWTAFLNRHGLDAEPLFSKVMERLKVFIEPVCQKVVVDRVWNAGKWQ